MAATIKGSQTSATLGALARPEPSGVGEMVSMMRGDHIVTLADRVFHAVAKTAKATVSVRHTAREGTPEHHRQSLLAEQLTSLWGDVLSSVSEYVSYGRVAFEKVWAASPEARLTFIRTLDPLPYEQTELKLGDDGGFEGVLLRSGRNDVDDVDLTARYSWWAALDATPLEPHGRSRYLGAPFERWKNRREVLHLRDVFTRRFALGGGVIRVPDPDELEEVDGQRPDPVAAASAAHADRQSGGAAIVPNTRDAEGNFLWDYEQYDTSVQDSSPIIELVDALDAEQLLAFGIPPKVVIEGSEVGSFAMVTWQILILYSVVDDILSQLSESFQRYVVEKVAEVNWPRPPGYRLDYTPLMDRPDDLASEITKAWLTSPQLSPLVLSGAVDVQAVMEAVGIPLSGEVSERLLSLTHRLQGSPTTEMEGPLAPFLNRSGK